MHTFKNLACALAALALVSFVAIVILLLPVFSWMHSAVLSAPVSVFAVASVTMVGFIVMYSNAKYSFIKVLKRRGGRVYGELLQYKMKLIDVMDGQKLFVDSEKYLYNEDDFQRIKKFLYEEYFLLLQFEPFLPKSKSATCVQAFYPLHKELEVFIRSVNYDKIDFDKFKILYQKTYGQPITNDTPPENYDHPSLKESFDAIVAAHEYALSNTDRLLSFLDQHLVELDKYFKEGVPWSVTKSTYDSDFQMWMYSIS